MGMDVYGKQPTDKAKGEYFRNNAWWWRPLADYCCRVAPAITAHCTYWQSNDADGLNAEESTALADALQAEIDAGRTATYAMDYTANVEGLPDERCELCEGTGRRQPPPNAGAGDYPCNGCESTGRRKSSRTFYPFSVENVQEFIVFLRHCGGFEIC